MCPPIIFCSAATTDYKAMDPNSVGSTSTFMHTTNICLIKLLKWLNFWQVLGNIIPFLFYRNLKKCMFLLKKLDQNPNVYISFTGVDCVLKKHREKLILPATTLRMSTCVGRLRSVLARHSTKSQVCFAVAFGKSRNFTGCPIKMCSPNKPFAPLRYANGIFQSDN
jgi:hypothetical protein